MIAETSHGKQFVPLVAYLLRGYDGQHPERVAWSDVRNLSTDDPDLAATVMQATADRNVRVAEPVYQITLTFPPTDHVTPETMRAIADRVLKDLGLDGHQVVMASHNDRPHAHVHLAINRIHPDTHYAWDRWRDWVRIDRTLRAIEGEHGLTITPGPLDRQPTAREVTPDDMHQRATEQLASQEKVAHAAEAIRAVEQSKVAGADIAAAERQAQEIAARTARIDRAITRALESAQAFDHAFAQTYSHPDLARAAFHRAETRTGANEALKTLAQRPETFGQLKVERHRMALGLLDRRDEGPARTAAQHAAGLGVEAFAADHHLRTTAKVYYREVAAQLGPATGTVTPLAEVARLVRQAAAKEATAVSSASRTFKEPTILHQVARTAVAQLTPPEIRRLHAMLTNPQTAIVREILHALRNAAIGHEPMERYM